MPNIGRFREPLKPFRTRPPVVSLNRTERAGLIAALTEVLSAHVPLTQRPDPMHPEDVLLEWRPQAEGATILDVGWEASGIDVQIGLSSGYFDLFGPPPDEGAADARPQTLVELAEAIAPGRLVAVTGPTRKARIETTVVGRRSGPRIFRAHERAKGTPDTHTSFAPW